MQAPDSLLRMEAVSKYFPGVRALHDISFDVRAGEVHGLVGENGAGKSTLMGVASGGLAATSGRVFVAGQEIKGEPEQVRALGLAIVRQEPALLPDLSVAENLYLGLPMHLRPSLFDVNGWAVELLHRWNAHVAIEVKERVATLTPEQKFIVEIVKALACEPKVLVLDEPTEHLTSDDVARLFERIREVTARGAAVVYISHRIREVQAIADRLTVLRDGEGQGTYDARQLSEDQIVTLIVGTSLATPYPAKPEALAEQVVLQIEDFSGVGFSNVSLALREGEILGLAGIDGNGQREFMRALAGITRGQGKVAIEGRSVKIQSTKGAMRAGLSHLPGDRHKEGIFPELSVRENFSVRSGAKDLYLGLIHQSHEERRAKDAIMRFAVKTPGSETQIRALSGGNQQKIVLASVLESNPRILLVDEPTQGVDVGARAEIYRILRENAARGLSIIVVSSDVQEVAGLSDRVAIFSRGRVVELLEQEQVNEDHITAAVLKSTQQREKHLRHVSTFWKWAAGNAAPLVMLSIAILLLGAIATYVNPFYISARSLIGMMSMVATLALVGYGQQILLLVGGIDLSVGPLMGLCEVVASFWLIQGASPAMQLLGWGLFFLAAAGVGATNWLLVEKIGLHPMVATLASFMAVQAVSLLLRPVPAGMLSDHLMALLNSRLGILPVAFMLAVIIAFALEFVLYRRGLGVALRALGSRPEAARTAGLRLHRLRLLAYVSCSVLAGVAAVTMMPQIGIGDPKAGLNYTLGSIAVVVLGGGSLFGGRGSFLGTLLGAIFITQVNSVTSFMQLDQAWQSYLLGGLVLAAVAVFSKSRQKVMQA